MPQAQALAGNAAAHAGPERPERILDPAARVSEILFGVIMALTFTTTVNAANGGAEDLRALLYAALGCNLAWGLVDAVMFLMNALTERGRDLVTVRAVRDARAPAEAHRVLREAMPPSLSPLLASEDIERLRQRLARMDDPPRPRLTADDWRGALAVFLLVFLLDIPDRGALPAVRRRDGRPARVKRRGDHDVVRLWLRDRALRRVPSLDDGTHHGGGRRRARRDHYRFRRVTPCDNC